MIIGSGMIAKAFLSYNDINNVVVFAKGVSNSLETKDSEFQRERDILENTLFEHKDKVIIYFGTCSVEDTEIKISAYIQHKLKMEKLIQESGNSYYIFRLPQVVGHTKSPTLINFLAKKIEANEEFNIWKFSKRNLIDVEDVYAAVDYLFKNNLLKNNIINIASNQTVEIEVIVDKVEKVLAKKGNYNILQKGSYYNIDIQSITPYLDDMNIKFDEEYIDRILYKYLAR